MSYFVCFQLNQEWDKIHSLIKDYFQQQQLENFKENSKQPHEWLSDIFDGKENTKMLTEPFNLRAFIPKKVEGAISINAVAEFTNKITKYSELISNSKKTSAENSIRLFWVKHYTMTNKWVLGMNVTWRRSGQTYFTHTKFRYK